jgi:hypothetical protein
MIDALLVVQAVSEAYHAFVIHFVMSPGWGQIGTVLYRGALGALVRFDILVASLLKRFDFRVALLPKRFAPHTEDKVQLPKHPNT